MLPIAATAVGGCHVADREPSAATRDADAVPALGAGDLIAYGSGARREVSLAQTALAALGRACGTDERNLVLMGASPDHLELEGATAAALPLSFYRALMARVDSLLVAGDTLPAALRRDGAALFRRVAPGYDSLRVQRVVLRSRLAAEGERVVASRGRGPCR